MLINFTIKLLCLNWYRAIWTKEPNKRFPYQMSIWNWIEDPIMLLQWGKILIVIKDSCKHFKVKCSLKVVNILFNFVLLLTSFDLIVQIYFIFIYQSTADICQEKIIMIKIKFFWRMFWKFHTFYWFLVFKMI